MAHFRSYVSDLRHIKFDLSDQFFGARKLAYAADAVEQFEFNPLLVEISRPVEDVGFDFIRLFAKSRIRTDVDRGRMLSIGQIDIAGVNTMPWNKCCDARQIQRWKSNGPAAFGAFDDLPAQAVGCGEKCICSEDVARAKSFADARTRDPFLTRRDGVHDECLDASFAAEVFEHGDVAGALVTKVKIRTFDDSLRLECVDKDSVDELRRRQVKKFRRGLQDDEGIDALCLEKFGLALDPRKRGRRGLGPEQHERMRIKGDDNRRATKSLARGA